MKFKIYSISNYTEDNVELQAAYWFIQYQGFHCSTVTPCSLMGDDENNKKYVAKLVMNGRKGKVNPINAICITLEKRNPQNPEEDEYVIGGFNDLIEFTRKNGLWRC